MDNTSPKKAPSKIVFLAFFFALFLFFTPFEQSGPNPSMFPKYFAAGVSLILLMPLAAVKQIRLRKPSVLVLIALGTILFHTIVVRPVPAQFNLLIVANLVLAVILYEASFSWRREFASAVSWLLLVNAVIITIQALLFYVFSSGIFDFHKMIFGSDSRFVENFLNIARFSGLQVEPGTYANYIACLLAILILSSDLSDRVLWMSFVSLVSIFLTNSGSSVYFVPVLLSLLAYLGRKSIRPIHVAILLVAIAVYLHFSGILAHMESRFLEQDDGSLSHRVEGIDAYLAKGWDDKVFGVGFDGDPCVRCFYQDIGVTFNLITRGGCLVTLALALLLFRSIAVNGILLSTILFLIPLNEKMFFYEAPIWLFMLFAMTTLGSSKSSKAAREESDRLQLAKPIR